MASFNPLADIDDTTTSSLSTTARYTKPTKKKTTIFNIKVFTMNLSDKFPGIKNENQKTGSVAIDPSDYTAIQKGVKSVLTTHKAGTNPPTQVQIIGRVSCSNFAKILLPILAGMF